MGDLSHPGESPGGCRPPLFLLEGSLAILPWVSVVVTVYNYERYITKCLESIATQDYPRFQCIIVDDVSTDSSVERVKSFIKDHGLAERFRLVCHETNQGQLAAFRTGLAHATGEFVAFVDADDLWQPDFLSRHIEAHLGFQPVAFTSSDQYQINENDELIAGLHTDHKAQGDFVIVKPFHIFTNWWVWGTTSTMVFRKAVLEVIMPMDTEPFRRCADNYICHFAHLLGSSLLIPKRLGFYRRHGQNLFSGNRIIGGDIQPTGNMAFHPSHESVRTTVRDVLQANLAQFQGLLGRIALARSLAMTMTLPETLSLITHWLAGKKWKDANTNLIMTLLARNLVYRFRWWASRWLLLKSAPRMVVQKNTSQNNANKSKHCPN